MGWIDGDVGHGPAYRFTDPDGHVFELYYEAERYTAPEHLRPSWRNQPQRYVGRGAAVKRLDHVNVLAADVRANREFAQDVLGYRLYERIELDDGTETGAWLSVSIAAHELIYVADAYGAHGRLHHLAFWVDTREECLRAADLFVDSGIYIEAAPSKHAVAQGFFVYAYEPGRQPDRGDDRRLLRLRPGLRARRLDGGGARAGPVLGCPDDRELPHLRHAGRRGPDVNDRARFEVLPFARGEEEAAKLPEHVRLTVTCSPKHGLDHTVEVAGRLRALGHAVTVHLAARMVRNRAHLDELLAAMAQSGVDDAFVVGGDATPPEGPYASAVELLPLVHEHPNRPPTLGITGYPEGHPLIDSAALADALAQKSPLADYITTQLCFDPKVVLAWVTATREAGIALPVFVGLPGIVDRAKLLEISMRVGVGPSLSFLRKQGGLRNLLRLSAGSADSLYDALAPRVGDPGLNITGFHYFTFNRVLDTWRWEQGKRTGLE